MPYRDKRQQKEYLKKYRQKNKGKLKEYQKMRYLRDKIKINQLCKEYRKNNPQKVKDFHKRGQKKYRNKYPEKIKAQRLSKQIRIPFAKLCVDCNDNFAEHKHHEDYSKPLEIVYLCAKCHRERHS